MRSQILDGRRMFFFFFNDTANTEIYTLSLHDALPISLVKFSPYAIPLPPETMIFAAVSSGRSDFDSSRPDRKSTRLNSSHGYISYAVFCLKKKKTRAIMKAAQLPGTLLPTAISTPAYA